MLSQRTIRNKITASGVGLHSGKSQSDFHPAEPNTGVVFRMIDGDKKTEIPAILAHVGDITLSTSLERWLQNFDHRAFAFCALAGTGVDNCIIDCDGPEIPMDGSRHSLYFYTISWHYRTSCSKEIYLRY